MWCTCGNVDYKPEVQGRGPDLRCLGVIRLEVAQSLKLNKITQRVNTNGEGTESWAQLAPYH